MFTRTMLWRVRGRGPGGKRRGEVGLLIRGRIGGWGFLDSLGCCDWTWSGWRGTGAFCRPAWRIFMKGASERTGLRKGAPWLKTMLVQCAWAAKRKKDSYYKAQFFRLQSKRGPQKAICAVAASLLTAIYHMLKDGTLHHDLGAGYFDRRAPHIKLKRLVNQITRLGFEVTLQPIATAA